MGSTLNSCWNVIYKWTSLTFSNNKYFCVEKKNQTAEVESFHNLDTRALPLLSFCTKILFFKVCASQSFALLSSNIVYLKLSLHCTTCTVKIDFFLLFCTSFTHIFTLEKKYLHFPVVFKLYSFSIYTVRREEQYFDFSVCLHIKR